MEANLKIYKNMTDAITKFVKIVNNIQEIVFDYFQKKF
jgi:hypothetical protein